MDGRFVIKLRDLPVGFAAQMFYFWLYFEYGKDEWVSLKECEKYSVRRNLYRLIRQLDENNLIEREYRYRNKAYIKLI